VFVFLPCWYKQHPSLRSLFVSELPVFFLFIQGHYSSNLITNAARVTNIQHGALGYAFRPIFHGQENIMGRTRLSFLLIYLLKQQHNTNASITSRVSIICSTLICRYSSSCAVWVQNLLSSRLLSKNLKIKIPGGSNMTGTDLCVNKPHCAAAVRP